jgi:hypothetical protein
MVRFIRSYAPSRRTRLVVAVAAFCSAPALAQGADVPYLIRLVVSNVTLPGAEKCVAVPAPTGTRVVVETVALDVIKNVNLAGTPKPYVLTAVSTSSSVAYDRGLVIPVTQRYDTTYAGHLQTMVMSGPVSVGVGTISLSLCAPAGVTVEGLLVGHLLPL